MGYSILNNSERGYSMKKTFKIISIIFLILGAVASVLQIVESFFPEAYPGIVVEVKAFIAFNWLMLVVIGLLTAILVLLVKKNGGSHLSNGKQPPQSM
jgi:hypothetical protein